MSGILTTHFDTSKIFLWNNRYKTATYTNSTGATVNLVAGRLMGRILASQKLLPLASAAVDGSQFPVAVLAESRDVANGETVTLTICVGGDVAEEKIILSGADTLSTEVSGRSIRDRIAADTLGVHLVTASELTGTDN
jgi:hypothetical protein